MKIICVGRNYALHATELGNAVPTEPVVFLKPQSALLKNNEAFYYPAFSKDIHYECEVVLRICKNGKHIQKQFAQNYFDAISVGIDFTARDIQEQQKQKGLPWEIAKAFDNSAVVGSMIAITEADKMKPIAFSLIKNGEVVQAGNTAEMLFSFSEIIAYVSSFFSLQTGDLIYTGTPAGVGPIAIGDKYVGKVGEQILFEMEIK
jgi:2-keto-4-pentenoate hydratase/2-oxohepta-3-ene-1,7-dioic acid hydratase in catechol pathway